MRIYRLAKAQFGDRDKRAFSRALTLSSLEQPSAGWVVKGDLSYRIGVVDRPQSAMEESAFLAGEFYTHRLFRKLGTSEQVNVSVRTLVNNEDAESLVGEFTGRFARISNKYHLLTTVSKVDVETTPPHWTAARATGPLFFEQSRVGLRGRVRVRYIISSVDNILFTVACSRPKNTWSWEEAMDVASSQASLIQTELDAPR
jgi:hypothetical protein